MLVEAKIKQFLDDAKHMSQDRYDIVCAIRQVFCDSGKGFEQGFKYGGITFDLFGDLIAGIYSYKQHVSVEFSQGKNLTDLHNVLEGSGRFRRHIKIHKVSDIKAKCLCDYIKQAADRALTSK